MFQTKKKKIKSYLENKQSAETLTAFDVLLHDYLSGDLESEFEAIGLSGIKIHIDWLNDYKCIEVEGSYSKYLIEIQIEPSEFSIAYDEDEPDDYKTYPLISKDDLFLEVKALLKILN